MSDALRQWCEENEFDVNKFIAADLTIEKLLATKSSIVLAEQLGIKTSAERGRLIDGIKALREKLKEQEQEQEPEEQQEEVGLYDDPEVIVKDDNDNDNDDYNEFENNDEKEQKSIHEESFMLRSNFSDDPQDQWDIVKFFDNNEKFKQFKPILLLQMQIQNSANYNGNDQMGNQNDQLDHLLDSMLGGPHQNDSSSDSDEDIYASQMDSNTFRDYINSGYMPSPTSLIYDNILSEYKFNDVTECIRGDENEMDEKAAPFYACINYAQALDYQSSKDDNKEHFINISLQNNISNENEMYKRYKLNLVIVLETSSSMNDIYNGSTSKTKQTIANQLICDIIGELAADDKFCLVSFNDSFNIDQPLDDMASVDLENVRKEIMAIESSGGGTDFDEGYNAALGQLQELFDAQIMAAAAENDDEKIDEVENRIILITNNLPNYDSSLMDLMQVYSDSDENKIYATFINIGDLLPNQKLVSSIHKLRGCNIINYVNVNENEISNEIKTDFHKVINPIFFNINLQLKSLSTDTIYGYNNNMKKITKLNSTGTVKTVKTFFGENNRDKMEVITIRLQPPEDDDDNEEDYIAFDVELLYEARDGKIGEVNRNIKLLRNESRGIVDKNDETYFDNQSIRKRVMLIKYIELLNEWVARDSNSENTYLNVSDQFKTQFEMFIKYFQRQIQEIKNEKLNQEIEILNKLIQFDEKNAAELRNNAVITQ